MRFYKALTVSILALASIAVAAGTPVGTSTFKVEDSAVTSSETLSDLEKEIVKLDRQVSVLQAQSQTYRSLSLAGASFMATTEAQANAAILERDALIAKRTDLENKAQSTQE